MRHLILILTSLLIGLSATAQSYFDDKSFRKPVSHKSVYDNDRWKLLAIERSPSFTMLKVKYTAAYMAQGWSESFGLDTRITDQDTGRAYPLINAYGIPRKPESITMDRDVNNLEIDATLVFPPIPESVRTVRTTLGLYDIDLGSVPVAPGGNVRFYNSKTNGKGNLSLDAVSDDGTRTLLFFSYTPVSYSSEININASAALKDKATGKTYNLTDCAGIPRAPEKLSVPYNAYRENPPVGFCLIFPSMSAAGVKTVDFIDSDWIISDISL